MDTPSFALISSLGAPVARAATVGYNGEIRENAFFILFKLVFKLNNEIYSQDFSKNYLVVVVRHCAYVPYMHARVHTARLFAPSNASQYRFKWKERRRGASGHDNMHGSAESFRTAGKSGTLR